MGTVVSVDECAELVDDNGVTWSLLGTRTAELEKGQRVQVTGLPRPESSAPDCAGAPLDVRRLTVL